jgi:hypothetical protein
MIPVGDEIASPVDAGTELEFRETWYARFYRHNRQAGMVDAAHAWHAMRSGHLSRVVRVTSAHRAPSGAYAQRASLCLFLAAVGTRRTLP